MNSTLPTELKSEIIKILGAPDHPLAYGLHREAKAALANLCAVNKEFRALASRELYRSVIISNRRELAAFVSAVQPHPILLDHLKSLSLRSHPDDPADRVGFRLVAQLVQALKLQAPNFRRLSFNARLEEGHYGASKRRDKAGENEFIHLSRQIYTPLPLHEIVETDYSVLSYYLIHRASDVIQGPHGFNTLRRALCGSVSISDNFSNAVWELPFLETLVLCFPTASDSAWNALFYRKDREGISRKGPQRKFIVIGQCNYDRRRLRRPPTNWPNSGYDLVTLDSTMSSKGPHIGALDRWLIHAAENGSIWNMDEARMTAELANFRVGEERLSPPPACIDM